MAELDFLLERVWLEASIRAGGSGDIEGAIEVLRQQLTKAGADPWWQVRLAEALSRTDSGVAEAQRLLEDLAKQHLIMDAEGYATLARLRRQSGDREGAAQATALCQTISKRRNVCSDTPLPPLRKAERQNRPRCFDTGRPDTSSDF